MIRGYKLGFSVTGSYTLGVTSYTTWDNFIATIISNWGNWAANCPLVPGMTFSQAKTALNIWSASQVPQVKYIISISEANPCVCSTVKVCNCIEVIGSQGHATQSACESAQNCCGSGVVSGCTDPNATNYDPSATIDDGSCVYATNCCDDINADNYDATCTTPCQDITVGDYNQTWINQGSVVWNNSTSYGSPWANYSCGYFRGDLVKHNGIIWMTRHAISIPHGQEPGNENPIPENGNGLYPNWFKASDFYNQGAVTRRCCCEYVADCSHNSSQQNFNELGAGYWNVAPSNWHSCTPIIYGCMDPTALNYYVDAMVENGNCVY